MILAHNLESMNTNRQYKIVTKNKEKAAERLASGYKINRAADNAAGLAISEKMRSQVRGLKRAEKNVQEGINFVQTADGALSEIQAMMHRVHELAVQAANDTNTDEDRKFIDEEIQMYKEEINYIFEETEYNTIKIWDTNTDSKVQIGTEKKKALDVANSGSYISTFSVNEKNKAKIAYNGYKIEVQGTNESDPDTYGFKIKWQGWDNKDYETKLISWDDVKAQGGKSFSCKLSDYVDLAADPDLAGIDFPIRWTTEETATIDDIANSIDGTVFSSYVSSSESTTMLSGQSHPGVSFSIDTNYLAELASERNVEQYDTDWIQPELTNGTNVIDMPGYTDTGEDKGWKIHFNMPNIGNVTATSSSLYYYSSDTRPEKEGIWWRWGTYSNGGRYKYSINHNPTPNDGTLHSVTDCITNSKANGTSLSKDNEGSGTIVVTFNMTPDAGSFTYEGRTENSIGTIRMYISSVTKNDTEETIMNKVKAALNDATVFDVYEGNNTSGKPYSSTHYVDNVYENNYMIDVPVYETYHDRAIQSGANTDQAIHLIYKSLRLMNLGIHDSNVLTREAASKTIADVQAALDIVSEQRSLFGAYQNRMEYAEKNDANGAENTQAAESRIRDADMADEMVVFSKESILQQAATSMLAQANQSKQGILSLLNG